MFNTGQQQRSQNQDELHQKHNQEGTDQDEMTSQEIIANELDPSKKKSEKNEVQVQQLLTLCGPLVESPGK